MIQIELIQGNGGYLVHDQQSAMDLIRLSKNQLYLGDRLTGYISMIGEVEVIDSFGNTRYVDPNAIGKLLR